MTPLTLPASVDRSVDIGYRNTKFIIDDRRTCRLFPSLAPPADANRRRTTFLKDRRTSVVYVDGAAYEVGEDSGLFVSTVPILHRDYIETPEYRALLYGVLDAMQTPAIDLLVTGLPVHLHATRWERLQSLLVGVHTIRPGVSVEIRKVAVVAQPMGGFVLHCFEQGDWKANARKIVLVVDPGFFTFDWMVIRGLTEIPGRSGSVECGVSEYISSIQQHLSTEIGDVHTDLHRIDDGLRQGHFRIRGQPVDLAPLHQVARGVVDRAVAALRNRVGAAHEIDQIVVVGGGAPYFVDGLRKAFPKHPLHTVPDPVFANVRGFQLIGELFRSRMTA